MCLGIVNPGGIVDVAVGWLLQRKLVVPADAAMVGLFAGVGLGAPQLGVLLGVVMVVVAVLLLRRHRHANQAMQDTTRR